MKPALPWVICAIGSLLMLVLLGSGRAMIMAGILASVNALVALGLGGGGWRTTKSRAVVKNNARQFLGPSLVFLVILCVIGLIRIHQLSLPPR